MLVGKERRQGDLPGGSAESWVSLFCFGDGCCTIGLVEQVLMRCSTESKGGKEFLCLCPGNHGGLSEVLTRHDAHNLRPDASSSTTSVPLRAQAGSEKADKSSSLKSNPPTSPHVM